jgi:N-acetylmuramoyl-L-alanine amidase
MPFKLCIDPGHGLGNRKPGVPDPGCVRGLIHEADIVMDWARELSAACRRRGVPYWLTRSAIDPAPLSKRVAAAKQQGCTHLISLHVNDADSPKANGTETLIRSDAKNIATARMVHHLAVQHLGLRDRKIQYRNDLAILKHPNSCLLELGFIGSSSDLAAMQCPTCRADLCNALADLYASLMR